MTEVVDPAPHPIPAPTSVKRRGPGAGLAIEQNNFDFLRFVLASSVIYSHSYVLLDRPGEVVVGLTHDQFDAGRLAVTGFFVISGYLITISWQRSRGAIDFLRKRILRIFPGFVGMALLCLLVIAPWIHGSPLTFWKNQSWAHLGFQTLTLHTLTPTDFNVPASADPITINGSLWTIRIEFECYILTMVLGLLGFLRKSIWVPLLCLLVWMLQSAIALDWQLPSWIHAVIPASTLRAHPRFASFYLVGTVAALWREDFRVNKLGAALSVGVLAITSVLGGFAVVAPIAFSYLIFVLAFAKKPDFSRFAKRGDLSYGIYLYGWPLQQLVLHVFDGKIWPSALSALAFAGTLILAVLSWRFVEHPALSLKKTGRRVAAATTSG